MFIMHVVLLLIKLIESPSSVTIAIFSGLSSHELIFFVARIVAVLLVLLSSMKQTEAE